MGAPHIHADLSARRFGGEPNDYIKIHEVMDSSKKAFADVRHRALTHNSWFVTEILERIFGATIRNSDGNLVAVREIGQWHIMEDYGGAFPSAQDFLQQIPLEKWMNNGEDNQVPPSNRKLPKFDKRLLEPKQKEKKKKVHISEEDFFRQGGCGGGGRLD
jgi:hypothetical protein